VGEGLAGNRPRPSADESEDSGGETRLEVSSRGRERITGIFINATPHPKVECCHRQILGENVMIETQGRAKGNAE
jgi:hypothetical protein